MNNTVIPVVTDVVTILGMKFFKTWCICGEPLSREHHNYCPKCGRRVLWEDLKK